MQAIEGPLTGVRILDLGSAVMVPFSTQILGDLGAEVVMVEPVEGGTNRGMGTVSPDTDPQFSGIALNLLRNKRSVAVNLKEPKVRDAILRFASTCDAVVTNLRPKPLARLGLDYAALKAERADIIVCQALGFSSDGPRGDDPAYDDIIQAESGLIDCLIRAGAEPTMLPTLLADKYCGMAVANALMAALMYRMRTGLGQRVEVPMLDVMRAFVMAEHGAEAIGEPPRGQAGYGRILTTERRPMRTKDGWIAVLPTGGKGYDLLFAEGGMEHLIGDPRMHDRALRTASSGFVYAQLQAVLALRTTSEWIEFCTANGIPVGVVGDLDKIAQTYPVAQHPVAGAYRSIPHPISYTEGAVGMRSPAPSVGQDTAAILADGGLSTAEIAALIEAGAAR